MSHTVVVPRDVESFSSPRLSSARERVKIR